MSQGNRTAWLLHSRKPHPCRAVAAGCGIQALASAVKASCHMRVDCCPAAVQVSSVASSLGLPAAGRQQSGHLQQHPSSPGSFSAGGGCNSFFEPLEHSRRGDSSIHRSVSTSSRLFAPGAAWPRLGSEQGGRNSSSRGKGAGQAAAAPG